MLSVQYIIMIMISLIILSFRWRNSLSQQRVVGFYCHNRFLDNSLNKKQKQYKMMTAVF